MSTPEDKLDIIQALQQKGHVVALAGRGHGDVASLAQADLGVVMGSTFGSAGTVADAVALTGSLSALVDLLRAGRRGWDNLQKGVAYIFGVRLAYAGMMVAGMLVTGNFPVTPSQLLCLEVLAYGPLASFVVEPAGESTVLSGKQLGL